MDALTGEGRALVPFVETPPGLTLAQVVRAAQVYFGSIGSSHATAAMIEASYGQAALDEMQMIVGRETLENALRLLQKRCVKTSANLVEALHGLARDEAPDAEYDDVAVGYAVEGFVERFMPKPVVLALSAPQPLPEPVLVEAKPKKVWALPGPVAAPASAISPSVVLVKPLPQVEERAEKRPSQGPLLQNIITLTAASARMSVGTLLSRTRRPVVVHPRQTGMYLCYELTSRPLVEIGKRMGGLDHTTVLHSLKMVEKRLAQGDGRTRDIVGRVVATLAAHEEDLSLMSEELQALVEEIGAKPMPGVVTVEMSGMGQVESVDLAPEPDEMGIRPLLGRAEAGR
jgi:hypothetical protein